MILTRLIAQISAALMAIVACFTMGAMFNRSRKRAQDDASTIDQLQQNAKIIKESANIDFATAALQLQRKRGNQSNQ